MNDGHAVRMIELVINATPPGLNELRRWARTERYKEFARWNRWVFLALTEFSPRTPEPLARAKVNIERRSPGQLEPENLQGSCQVVLDVLREQGVIEDARPDRIELVATQSRGKPRTTIRITPLPLPS